MWFKNLRILRLDTRFGVSAKVLLEKLNKHRFTPSSNQEPLSMDWLPLT
ncbi:recombination-associated protein RdgC [Alcaligenes pakistanensis]|nr:recombination-associated protein RdgC [Alcaligenes pakistanensis]